MKSELDAMPLFLLDDLLRKIVGTKKQTSSVTIYNLTFSQNSNEKGKLKFTMKIFLASEDDKRLFK